MTKAIINTYSFVQDYRRKITLSLLAICLTMAFIYAVNLYQVISHTIALQNVTKEQARVDVAVQALDTQYLALSSKITPDAIHAYGFDQGKVTAFISRTTALGRATTAGHGL